MSTEKKTSELAQLVTTRLEEIGGRKNQRDVSEEVGFPTANMISLIKSGATKLALDRVEKMAKALEIDLSVLMLPALRQFYSTETIAAIRDAFAPTEAETKTEREILAIARNNMDVSAGLSFETRQRLKEVFAENTPKRA